MYVIDQYGKKPIFQINQHIGFDDDIENEDGTIEKGDGQGINGIDFAKEFFETDILNPDVITLYVNTMGGDVKQSIDMLTAIARVRTKTHGIISGFAYSCGGWIPLGCDIVDMNEHASWMCHLPYNPNDPEKKSPFLDSVLNMVATIISSKSGRNGKPKKTIEEIKDMMIKKTYLNAKQMYEEGLIDNIVDLSGKKIKVPKEESFAWNIETDYKVIKNFYKERQIALNKFLDNNNQNLTEQKINTMSQFDKVVNRLNNVKAVNIKLTDDAGEEQILDSIVKMENKILNLSSDIEELNKLKETTEEKLKAANDSKSEMQKKMTELQSAKNDIDQEVVNLKAKMDNMEAENKELKTKETEALNKAKDSELKIKTERAEKLINRNIEIGKITAETKEKLEIFRIGWIEDATNNFERVERHFDSIPLHMSMPRPDFQENNNAPDGKGGSVKDFLVVNKQERAEKLKTWKENPQFT